MEKVVETLRENDSVDTKLHKMLSVKSVVSNATSSFVEAQQEAALNPGNRDFRLIGFGMCGFVFEIPGQPRILKKAIVADATELNLKNDSKMHAIVSNSFARQSHLKIDVHVPQHFTFIPKEDKSWWAADGERFPVGGHRVPNDILVAERIFPLPKVVRELLIERYCPEQIRSRAKEDMTNKDCLVRLYLGRRQVPNARPSRFFTLRNLKLYLNHMEDLHLEVCTFAFAMADALAVMHWDAHIDARDVEFVLGSAPTNSPSPHTTTQTYNFLRRSVHLWLLDFNQCREFSPDDEGIEQCVTAFFINDPYYPRPQNGQDYLWEAFRERYLHSSKKIVGEKHKDLPRQFMDRLEMKAKELAQNKAQAKERSDDGDIP